MKLMRAVCIYAFGGPQVLRYEDAPRPHPGEGEVLVRVHAAGINPVDWKVRKGEWEAISPHALPLILGWDLSGVVEDLGTNLKHFKLGDEVYGCADVSRDGAYAEFIAVRESDLARKPKSVDHIHAAAFPMAGLTAWQALFDAGGLAAGQRVLIHGAAGGVGSLAVQMARIKEAEVIGTASGRNHDFLRKLGVGQVVDYQRERFEEVVEPVDLVLDTLGGDIQERSWKVLKPGGILVSIVSPPSSETAAAHGVRQAFVTAKTDASLLCQIAALADAQKLKAIVETILPLSDATRGQELSEQGHTRGKIVLRVVQEETV
jgi:NADPH:quinone reductase-like Zn-dependent oxidoreductase